MDISSGLLMGVLNVTPDSFSGDGFGDDPHAAVRHGLELCDLGADIVDVGGESTRPGSTPVSPTEEMSRVLPVVAELVAKGVVVSIDTSKPEVAENALAVGAKVVNDVKACQEPGMAELIAASGAAVVLAHTTGTSTAADHPSHRDIVDRVERFLLERVNALVSAGVEAERIAIDPGIGFGKTKEHNVALLGSLGRLASHEIPLLLGTSRKRFLGTITGSNSTMDLDMATATTTALGYAFGARVFRVHDVPASRRALSLAAAIVRPQQWDEWSRDSSRGDSPG